MTRTNVVTADFTNTTLCLTESLYQYDYGQILKFEGIESLPDAYEVYFSNEQSKGEATKRIGTADGVVIPDVYLTTGKKIYAWMVLHTGESDGEVVYTVMIPVMQRSEPIDVEPTPVQQDAITEAIAALQTAVGKAEEAQAEWESMSATAESLPSDSEPTASYADGVLTLGIPEGRQGKQGDEGNGIESTVLNPDYTLTITYTDGTSYTTEPIRGAKGDDGVGIASTMLNADYTLTITLTDGTSYTTPSIRGQKGEKGDKGNTPTITTQKSGRTTTIYADDVAVGTVEDGENGRTPVITANKSGSVTTIYADSTAIATINDGQDGYTPIKGTDYWTAQDKTEIVDDVLESQELSDAFDSKAPVILNTASGSIASFNDGADDMPLKKCLVSIEPVQDLHGYDAPWPAGGGKNKANIDEIQIGKAWNGGNNSERATLFIPVLPSTMYTVSVTDFTGLTLTYVEKSDVTSATNIYLTTFVSGIFTRTTNESTGCVAIQLAKTGGISASDIENVKIQFELGSTATSYEPYSNICQITGWDGVTVCNDPKYGGTIEWNQIAMNGDFSDGTKGWTGSSATLTVSDGVARATLKGIAWNNDIRQKSIPVMKDHVYFVSCEARQSSTNFSTMFRSPDGQSASLYFRNTEWMKYRSFIYSTNSSPNGFAFSVFENGTDLSDEWFEIKNVNVFDLTQMFGAGNEPSTVEEFAALFPNDYYPYNAGEETCVSAVNGDPHTFISITFPSEAGTVYGGTIDVVSGELIVDRASLTINGSEGQWASSASSGTNYHQFVLWLSSSNYNASASSLCDKFGLIALTDRGTKTGLVSYEADKGYRFALTDDMGIETMEQWKAWLAANNVQLVVKLATPIVYHLTPTEIRTLLGTNNIWADTGDTEVTYSADTKEYVDGHDKVTDVQINRTSVLNNGIANIGIGLNKLGLINIVSSDTCGLYMNDIDGRTVIHKASDAQVKAGTMRYRPIVPDNQHTSAFYGLAKAAGDATQSESSNAVGTYTDEAKIAIQKMLGIYQAPWELIREDTFTNDTFTVHNVTVDGNGNAFELTDAVMLFELPVQSNESRITGYIQFYDGNTLKAQGIYCNMTQAASANGYGVFRMVRNEQGLIFDITKSLSAHSNSGNLAMVHRHDFSSATSGIFYDATFVINKVSINAVTGTGHYKLYGKRKWQ